MTWLRDTDYSLTNNLELSTLENGCQIYSMARVKKAGTMARLSTLAPSIRVKRAEKADLNGKMEAFMREILLMEFFKDMESTILPSWTSGMRVSSDLAIWREKESRTGVMVESMRATSKMERKMEKVHLYGQMEINILEVGEMISSMELLYIMILSFNRRSRENGSMARDTSG